MDLVPDITVFRSRLQYCLGAHGMSTSQLAEKTALEKTRLDGMLGGAAHKSNEPSISELLRIADAFRIEPSVLISSAVELPYSVYRLVACCGYSTAAIHGHFLDALRASQRYLSRGNSPQSERKIYKNSDVNFDNKSFDITEDNLVKILETLSACQFLQELWEYSGYEGHKYRTIIDQQEINRHSPEDAGKKAAGMFRRSFGLAGDKPVTHIRQFARKAGVHVFRQNIHPSKDPTSQDSRFNAVCLFGKIGDNENGRIAIFDSKLPYAEEQFSVAHELGHALLDDLSIPEKRPALRCYKSEPIREEDERRANAFALELLLPQESLKTQEKIVQIIRDFTGLNESSKQAFCNPTQFVSKLLDSEVVTEDTNMELYDALQKMANAPDTESPCSCEHLHYSPTLRDMFEDIKEEGYRDSDIDRLKDIIDRGLSYHFVDMCKRVSAESDSKKEEIMIRCADVFSVPMVRIEEAFEMYNFIKLPSDHPAGT